MIFNKMLDVEEKVVVFDDALLQVVMGQWLGILPATSKQGPIFSHYKQPKNAETLLNEYKISKDKLEKIELEFAKLLKVLGLEDDIYKIQNFDQENHTFICNLITREEEALIKYDFNQFITFPSVFTVLYDGIKSQYGFITDKISKENILVSVERQDHNVREVSNRNSYEMETSDDAIHIKVEYLRQLKSLNEDDSMIDTNQLVEALKNPNTVELSLMDISQILGKCLKADISKYKNITIGFNQSIEGNNYTNKIEILEGKVQKLEVVNQQAGEYMKKKFMASFNSISHDEKGKKM